MKGTLLATSLLCTVLQICAFAPKPRKMTRFAPIMPAGRGPWYSETTISLANSERKRGWHRSVLKSVFGRAKDNHKFRMHVVSEPSVGSNATETFLLQEFEQYGPSVLSQLDRNSMGDSKSLCTYEGPTSMTSLPREMKQKRHLLQTSDVSNLLNRAISGAGSLLSRTTLSWLESMLTERFDRWSKGSHVNMQVQCNPTGNVVEILRGLFRCEAIVTFDRIVFGPIRMSGGHFEARRMALNLYSFSPIRKHGVRFPAQFDLIGKNVTFTERDLFESNCVRNGLRRLLTRILRKNQEIPTSAVSINSIKILSSGKLSCRGEAKTLFGTIVPFEVRTSIATTSRGHVLTFPGLELSLSPSIGFFVPVLPEVTLDLGHNAQLLHVELDGHKKQINVSARATITPKHTVKLRHYVQSKQSYSALFSCDVGRWLTKIGNFSR